MPNLLSPTTGQLMKAMTDVSKPNFPVEVQIDNANGIMWVNVGPVCLLRIQLMEVPVKVINLRD